MVNGERLMVNGGTRLLGN